MAKFKFGSKDPAGNAKSRAMLFFTAIIILAGLSIGYVLYKRHAGITPGALLAGTPGIESIPGTGQASSEYVKLQEQQNIKQAQQAAQQGTSAVPTITRTSYFGPSEFQGGRAPAGPPGCGPDELRRAREAGVKAEELFCKRCPLAALRAAGYTAGELAGAGYSAADLKNAGYSPAELRAAGFTPAELKAAGFTAAQLAAAGYTPNELSQAGYSAKDIANAGYTPNALALAGIGTKPSPNTPKDCNPNSLKQAHAQGVSAADLKKLGCGAAALRAAGYTAADLVAAGFTPEELRAAGYTPAELKAAGLTAGQLRRAGFSPADLKNAGFTAQDLKNAGFSPADLKNAGFTPNDLKAAGFTNGDLVRAGFNPSEIPGGAVGAAGAAGALPTQCTPDALRLARAQGVSAAAIRQRGCTPAAMLAAGYTPAELKAAGFSDDDLRNAGVGAAQLAAANAQLAKQCNIDALRQARAQGISAADLKNRGCSPGALLAAGYTPADLKAAGFSDDDLRAAGLSPAQIAAANAQTVTQCSPSALRQARAQGVSAAEMRKRGCGAAALLAAGYTPAELKAAGFTDDELRAAAAAPATALTGAGVPGSATIPSVGNTETQLAQLQANQEQQLDAQQKDQRLTQVQSSMASQASALFGVWTPPATQDFVQGAAREAKEATTTTTATTTRSATITQSRVMSAGPAVGGSSGPGLAETCADVKAGDIMMGVMTSTVNSDEDSPVMANIVSGKLRGAKLIGKFTLLKEKVLINFNKLDMPGKPASIGINAVAIDPETAHTALADCVDNHYWLRYGTLFASSFLSGLADAISQQGSQTSTGAGGILVTHDPLSAGQTIAVALGAVGSQYASVLGSNFTRPPTVMVYEGNSIGILFMQDLTVSPQCCPDVDKTCGNASGAGTCVTHY